MFVAEKANQGTIRKYKRSVARAKMNYPPMRVYQSAADFFVIDELLNVAERCVSKRDAEFLNVCRVSDVSVYGTD